MGSKFYDETIVINEDFSFYLNLTVLVRMIVSLTWLEDTDPKMLPWELLQSTWGMESLTSNLHNLSSYVQDHSNHLCFPFGGHWHFIGGN